MVTVNDTTADITSTGQSSLGTGMVTYAEANNLATLTFTMDALPDMARVTIRIESLNPVFVRAGVIRAFGDFLVAGDLFGFTTDDMTNERTILRNLAGIVRTSDVAAPGEIPTNWNPFAAGVSTCLLYTSDAADE